MCLGDFVGQCSQFVEFDQVNREMWSRVRAFGSSSGVYLFAFYIGVGRLLDCLPSNSFFAVGSGDTSFCSCQVHDHEHCLIIILRFFFKFKHSLFFPLFHPFR